MKWRYVLIVHILVFLLVALNQLVRGAEEDDKPAHPIDGTWRWNFTMPDGATTRPKLILATENGKLTGTTSFRAGTEAPITNAVLSGDELRFQVIRQRDGHDVVTTYTGKWIDKEIKGTVESNWAGEKQSYEWLARRAHLGAEGVWQWTNTFGRSGGQGGGTGGGGGRFGGRGGRGFVTRVELEQSGETLTGSMPGWRGGRRIEIKNGTIKNGEIYFEIEREFNDEKFLWKYSGKQTGDIIKGTIEYTTFDGEERKVDWEAKRVD